MHGIENKEAEGEKQYKERWGVFGWPVEPYSYRLFSRYMGKDPDIVPQDIGYSFVEDVLDPLRFSDSYSDKNVYDKLFVEGTTPVTVLRRMGGSVLMDKKYHKIYVGEGGINNLLSGNYDRLVLKPSIESGGGVGVMLFERKNGKYISVKENQELTLDFLMNYGDDFVLQEALKQHALLSKFNATSVNTLRIAVYRSVKDETINVTGALVRVGRSGEICDNACMGGFFVGINVLNGHLNNYACNEYGNRVAKWNDVDYEANNFVIPNWDKVIEFSKYICSQLIHSRLIQLDIALDEQGNPRLIEYNINGFGFWIFMYGGQNPFGRFTDEIIEYCKERKNKSVHFKL